jgi:hypothetical protein
MTEFMGFFGNEAIRLGLFPLGEGKTEELTLVVKESGTKSAEIEPRATLPLWTEDESRD